MELRLEIPQAVEIVNAPDLLARMERERADVVRLTDQVRDLRAIALETELQLQAGLRDVETAEWMMLHLHHFLAEWREEAQHEAHAVLFGAHQRAARVSRGASGVSLTFAGALEARRSRVAAELAERPIRWTCEPSRSAPTDEVPSAMPAPVAVARVRVAAEPASPVPAAIAEIDLVATRPAPLAEGGDQDFWPEETSKRRRIPRRRVSRALVLQALAAMAALAAVAVRFA